MHAFSHGFKHCRAHSQISLADDASLRENVSKDSYMYTLLMRVFVGNVGTSFYSISILVCKSSNTSYLSSTSQFKKCGPIHDFI